MNLTPRPNTGKINKNNKILIENFSKEKQWGAEKISKEFPAK